MRYILSRASREILTEAFKASILCAFDFDGTLAPIVEHPDKAAMRARTLALLGRLAAQYPCLIVSGRARTDILRRIGHVKVARVIGNHGAETGSAAQSPLHLVEHWKTSLQRELGRLPGLWIEDKGLSLAVHYRQTPQKTEARRMILAAAGKLTGAHVFGGKQVVNLVVKHAPNKGDALAAERLRLGCDCVLYVGDDENDEDAFALGGNVVPVRIGQKRRSHALYYLRTQEEVDDLLDYLVHLRDPSVVH